MEELLLRVQCFQLCMMSFSFNIAHVPGKELVITNTLFYAPALDISPADNLQEETRAYFDLVFKSMPVSEQHLEEIKRYQESDGTCQTIVKFCQLGWSSDKELSPKLRKYFPTTAEFTVENNLLLRGIRVVLPPPLRQSILSRIHERYQGIMKCRERARNSIWWPGIAQDIEQLVCTCKICIKEQNQRAQPLIPSALVELPW